MKISSTFHILVFLMAVLTFSRSLVTLAQQNPVEADAKAQAITDAERDVSKMYWFVTGCFLGARGIAMARTNTIPVPAGRLIGKSSAYVAVYTSSYYAKQTEIQKKWALRGCLSLLGGIVVFTVAMAVVIVIDDKRGGGGGWCSPFFGYDRQFRGQNLIQKCLVAGTSYHAIPQKTDV